MVGGVDGGCWLARMEEGDRVIVESLLGFLIVEGWEGRGRGGWDEGR